MSKKTPATNASTVAVEKPLSDRETLKRLTADLKAAASKLKPHEVRYLVDTYYQVQDFRIQAGNQQRAAEAGGSFTPPPKADPEVVVEETKEPEKTPEPNALTTWVKDEFSGVEGMIRKAMDAYTDSHPVGAWSKSITGIGPVIAAGLLAHIDITRAPTVGHIWRFVGLDPTLEWLGKEKAELLVSEVVGKGAKTVVTAEHMATIGQRTNRKVPNLEKLARNDQGKITRDSLVKALSRRPWNAKAKVLAWKLGESFVKVSNNDSDVYGKLYRQRKALEAPKNAAGDYAAQAKKSLETKKIRDADLKATYEAGQLPDGRLHLRAERWAVKIFLSHWHLVAYWAHYKKLPPPSYSFAILDHVHVIPLPNAELVPGLAEELKKNNRTA